MALKHVVDPKWTLGGQSKRDGPQAGIARKPGGGRKRKDGSDPVRLSPEMKLLRTRAGTLPKALERGPPGEEEIAAFVARYGECPEDRLTPQELWVQVNRPIAAYDIVVAEEYLDRLANGESVAWMVRHWPGFPGTRTIDGWHNSDEFRALKKLKLERRSESEMMFAEAAQRQVFQDVQAGKVPEKLAAPLVNAARFMADGARSAAEKHSREVYGEFQQVQAVVGGSIAVGFGSAAKALLEAVLATKHAPEVRVIEGEVD